MLAGTTRGKFRLSRNLLAQALDAPIVCRASRAIEGWPPGESLMVLFLRFVKRFLNYCTRARIIRAISESEGHLDHRDSESRHGLGGFVIVNTFRVLVQL